MLMSEKWFGTTLAAISPGSGSRNHAEPLPGVVKSHEFSQVSGIKSGSEPLALVDLHRPLHGVVPDSAALKAEPLRARNQGDAEAVSRAFLGVEKFAIAQPPKGSPMTASKAKGTSWESAIVDFLREHGAIHAERRALGGTRDRGDIAGLPGIVIEAKSAAKLEFASWLAEAEVERVNDGATHGLVWAKRRGKTSPGAGYAVMSGATLVRLLTEAGYIPAATP